MQAYWDGSQWTGHTAPLGPGVANDDNNLALLAHLLGIFTGFLGPLVLFLVKKDESPFVRHHASEALNFQLSLIIWFTISVILVLVLIGILMILALVIGAFVLQIVAAVAASRGEWYRYPLTIRFVS